MVFSARFHFQQNLMMLALFRPPGIFNATYVTTLFDLFDEDEAEYELPLQPKWKKDVKWITEVEADRNIEFKVDPGYPFWYV